jgi:hypothetical protein
MASDFQRRKISGVFGAMDADENGDGAISAGEYWRLIEAWTGA